eukprot:symbB.v1.2.023777.t1/scaffold2200.1/size85926/4
MPREVLRLRRGSRALQRLRRFQRQRFGQAKSPAADAEPSVTPSTASSGADAVQSSDISDSHGMAQQVESPAVDAETSMTVAPVSTSADASSSDAPDSHSKRLKVESPAVDAETSVTVAPVSTSADASSSDAPDSHSKRLKVESPAVDAEMSVTVAPVSSSKLLKVADLLGSFERNLILPVQQAPLVPSQLPQQAKRKFDDGKRVLVVRHGEGLHQIKGYVPKEGDLLGPDLTDAGKEQAREAKKRIVSELQRLGLSEESADLIVSSNLLRALHTALLLVPESFTSKVVVQPSLRERILDTRDEPSELEHLREWLMNSKYDEQEELIEAGSKATDFAMDLHDIYNKDPLKPTVLAYVCLPMSRVLFQCFLTVSLAQHNNVALFQPSEGLLSGRDFETSLKLPRPGEGWATEKVSLEVPQGIRLVKPESKPGWLLRWDGTTLVFEAHEAVTTALEFQLHLVAGCDFPNSSEAVTMAGRHVLVWRTAQGMRALNGSQANRSWNEVLTEAPSAFTAPLLEVTSDKACTSSSLGPGMQWLGQHVPAATQVAGDLEEKVVGLEEDRAFDGHDFLKPHDHRNSRHGIHSGMAFGRPVKTAVHVAPWPLWKVFGLLAFILLLLFLATLLVGFAASSWAHYVMSSSKQALLKDHVKQSCSETRGLEEAHLIENNVLGKRFSRD